MSLRFWVTLLVGGVVGLALFSIPESNAKCNTIETTWILQRKSVTLISGPASTEAVELETSQWGKDGSLYYSHDSGFIRLLTKYFSVESENANALY